MNYAETLEVKARLDKLNINNRRHVFEGSHRWPPVKELSYAFDWMEINADHINVKEKAKGKWLARADSLFLAEEFLLYSTEIDDIKRVFSANLPNHSRQLDSLIDTKGYSKEVRSYEKWSVHGNELQAKYLDAFNKFSYPNGQILDTTTITMYWWQNEIKMLNKYVKSKELNRSRMASRLLNLISANCATNFGSFIEQGDIPTATNLVELWLYINPEQIWPNWTAVRIYALSQDRKKTIKYLKKVVDLGIKPTQAMLKNSNLEFVKDSDAYASLAILVK
jgi:hypothetical protein